MPRKLPEALKKHQFTKGEKKVAVKPKAKAKSRASRTQGGFGRQGPGPQVRV
jgi:hypothetical protein